MLLGSDLGGDHDPASGFQFLGIVIPAGNAAELDIVHTAGHNEPAGGEHAVLVPAEHGNLGLEADGLAVILFGLFGAVPVPDGVIVSLLLVHPINILY